MAPVHALAIDEGRQHPATASRGCPTRPGTPPPPSPNCCAGTASRSARTIRPGQGGRRRRAELGKVESPPVYALVERMLTDSDNDLAEALARHVAIKEGRPATFAGRRHGRVQVLAAARRRPRASQVYDGSGLSTRNRISAAAMARLIALAGLGHRPGLHAVVSGMPIAGFSGTLGNGRRFTGGDSKGQVGLVRAKTGTLNNVNTLAGLATDQGRPTGHLRLHGRPGSRPTPSPPSTDWRPSSPAR